MTTIATLNSALTDRYELEREIGRGGMATVYLARDLRHDRRVAVKVLDPELGAVLGADRFLSEIRVTAHLQHPNLLPLFDSGAAGGLLFYVMPFVEGESLRARLDREKQLPIDETVRIATAIASALDYAHRHGVVHRDLKPENILLHDGQPVIADFGIALAVSNAGGSRVTQTGLSLGTPQYMSPEQATGDRGIDGRTDIYSLGAVTYEMLTGEPPHHGTSAQAIIAKLMTEEPRPVTTLRRSVPPHIEGAVQCALEKLPADRFPTARDFSDALQGAKALPTGASTRKTASAGSRGVRVLHAVPWVIAAAAVTFAVLARREPAPDPPTLRTITPVPPEAKLDNGNPFISISADGRTIVYVGTAASGPMLFSRLLADPQPKPIAGTDGGGAPFLSPDGQWVGFVNRNRDRVLKTPISGGTPVTVARVTTVAVPSCTWGADDVIVCGSVKGLMRVPATGGELTLFANSDTSVGETGQRLPRFLADGKTVAFLSVRSGGVGEGRLAFARLDGRIVRTNVAGTMASSVPGGALFYSTTDGVLMAVAFDEKRLRTIGAPVPVVEDLTVGPSGYGFWDLSRNGLLTYIAGRSSGRLVTVDRHGLTKPLTGLGEFRRPKISPDGTRIVIEVGSPADLWVYSMSANTMTRLTTGGGNSDPLWTPDGKRIIYTLPLDATGYRHLAARAADGSGSVDSVLTTPGTTKFALDWAQDGRHLIYDEFVRGKPQVISDLDMTTKKSSVIVSAEAPVRLPSLSPDGKWMAYESLQNGRREVFVTAYPGPAGHVQVSVNGGAEPLWSRTGNEIYYRDPQNLVAAHVNTTGGFVVTNRETLFEDTYLRVNTLTYDLLPDGKGFLMLQSNESARQLSIVANVMTEVKAKLASRR